MLRGTVLIPLLFNFYINDIQNHICDGGTLVQYADDSMVYVSSISSNVALSQFLKKLTRACVLFC